MSINRKQEEIIEEFSVFDDWMDKYSYIIELGNDMEEFDEQYKTEDNLIEGCQSKVWLHVWLEHGKVRYLADSDAVITKGLAALLIRVLSGNEPKEIMDADLYFVDKIGLKQHLSPTRSNGLLSMMKKMKLFAIAYNEKLKKS